MKEICRKLFDKLNNNAIRYCHFKSNEHLEEGLDGNTDLDILVDENHYSKMKTILEELGYKEFEPQEFCSYPGVTNWYGLDYETGSILHIHLHTHLITGKSLIKDYIIPWDQIILDASEMHTTGVRVNNPSMELILLFVRMAVKRTLKQNLKSSRDKIYLEGDEWKEVLYLRDCVKHIDCERFKKAYEMLLGISTFDKYKQMILNDEKISRKQFFAFQKYVRILLENNRRMIPVKASLYSFIFRVRRKVYMYYNEYCGGTLPIKKRIDNGGSLFAFIGIDGSGKSTMIQHIKEWMAEEFDVKSYYLGAGDGNKSVIAQMMIKVYQLMIKRRGNDSLQVSNMTRTVVKNTGIKSKLKAIFASYAYLGIAKNNLKSLKRAYSLCREGGIALCDRFPQSCIEVLHDGLKVQRYERAFPNSSVIRYMAKKERKIFNRIESIKGNFYIIRLNVDPMISYERKKENEINALERVEKAKTIRTLTYKNIKTIFEIDANKNQEEELCSIKKVIWEAI